MDEQSPEEKRLHELRKEISKNINAVAELKSNENYKQAGREVSLSFTKLEEAKMWLGKALGALGSELPEQYRDEAK